MTSEKQLTRALQSGIGGAPTGRMAGDWATLSLESQRVLLNLDCDKQWNLKRGSGLPLKAAVQWDGLGLERLGGQLDGDFGGPPATAVGSDASC